MTWFLRVPRVQRDVEQTGQHAREDLRRPGDRRRIELPLRTIRSRPSRSVTRMSPSGRNARLHGCESPVATGTTRIGSSDEKNVCGSAAAAVTNAAPARTRTMQRRESVPPQRTPELRCCGVRGVGLWEFNIGNWELAIGSCSKVPSIRTRPAYSPTAEERADACRA